MPQSPPQTLEEKSQQTLEEEIERPPQALEDPKREEREVEQPVEEVKNEEKEEGEEAAEVNKQEEQEESKELEEEIAKEKNLETVQQVPQPLNPRRRKYRLLTALARQKLGLLGEHFNPIPFCRKTPLDFSANEDLFRALDLWEFASLDLSFKIRPDLLILLIANYDLSKHRSFIDHVDISVGRSDLARALRLPVEKENGNTHQDIFSKDESKKVIEGFLSNYIFLQNQDEDEDDMCILPQEVVATTQLVNEGRANEVDWTGLIWALVEKELVEAPRLGICHYASHLQCLMRHQQPGLFEEEAWIESVLVPETESSMEISDSMDDEFGMKMRSLEELPAVGCGRQVPGLTSDMGENWVLIDGIEYCKGSEEKGWVNEGKGEGFEHCLQRCNSNDVRGMEFENLCKGEQMGREELSNLERLASTDLLHSMEAVQVSYSPRMTSLHAGDFVSKGVDRNNHEPVDPGLDGSFFFQKNGKKHVSNDDIEDDDDVGQFHQSNQQKKIRSGGLWEEEATSGFDSYMHQIQCTMGKAKMLYAEKEQACLDAHLQLQYLNEMLEQKDQIIRMLEKTQMEEHQKWQQNVHRYEHELNILANLVVGYKKALKETQNKFEEYRKKCPQGDEPLYRDVTGADGLVLTSRELERLRLEKEEEMRQTAEDMINGFQCDWLVKFENYCEVVMLVHKRLVELDGEVTLIKERFSEWKSKDALLF